ncbi:MAG: hypothetical protein CMQ34_11705 [Gammaproteobacteria bacterium]|nr:hypothetical protein [Gammaproteobacteria bacterium]|tara:strand:- start:6058 stop:6357 length:300 start_codon:yes stop_codon:yes gene_type:complete
MVHEIDTLFFDAIKKQAYAKKLMSREHFSVDGTLLVACALMKWFRLKGGADDVDSGDDFYGQTRCRLQCYKTVNHQFRLSSQSNGSFLYGDQTRRRRPY